MSNTKTVVTELPDYQLERLAEPLIEIVARYFENPDVQKRFEAWQKAREAGKQFEVEDATC